jgi:GNAT superfamily N-acetyltransferase
MKYISIFLLFLGALSGDFQIEISHELKDKETALIENGLKEFNAPYLGPEAEYFAVYLKDEKGKILGGVLTWTRPGFKLLYIGTLWLPEEHRGKGYGTKLMLAAEAEGKKQGCTVVQVDTMDFQAAPFYKKLGYRQIGHIKKLFGDHDIYFFRKDLTDEGIAKLLTIPKGYFVCKKTSPIPQGKEISN